MKIEELADLTADKLEALSDVELDKILSPMYHVTRPEQVQRKAIEAKPTQQFIPSHKQAALDMLKEAGVDISFMKRKKR